MEWFGLWLQNCWTVGFCRTRRVLRESHVKLQVAFRPNASSAVLWAVWCRWTICSAGYAGFHFAELCVHSWTALGKLIVGPSGHTGIQLLGSHVKVACGAFVPHILQCKHGCVLIKSLQECCEQRICLLHGNRRPLLQIEKSQFKIWIWQSTTLSRDRDTW